MNAHLKNSLISVGFIDPGQLIEFEKNYETHVPICPGSFLKR
jgi:hypothetical protein